MDYWNSWVLCLGLTRSRQGLSQSDLVAGSGCCGVQGLGVLLFIRFTSSSWGTTKSLWWSGHSRAGEVGLNWVRLAPNGTNLGLLRPVLVHFGSPIWSNLTHFWLKYGIHGAALPLRRTDFPSPRFPQPMSGSLYIEIDCLDLVIGNVIIHFISISYAIWRYFVNKICCVDVNNL